MELDDFRNINIKGTPPEFNQQEQNKNQMDTFIEELKAADSRERKKIVGFIIIFGIFVAVYSSSLSIHKGTMRDGFAILVLAFVLILAYMLFGYLRIKRINYTAPTIQFLGEAKKRHSFMPPREWFFVVPLLALLIAGGSLIVHSAFTRYFGVTYWPLTIYLLFMACVVGVGFWASKKHWKREKGEMLEKIRKMQQEFGE